MIYESRPTSPPCDMICFGFGSIKQSKLRSINLIIFYYVNFLANSSNDFVGFRYIYSIKMSKDLNLYISTTLKKYIFAMMIAISLQLKKNFFPFLFLWYTTLKLNLIDYGSSDSSKIGWCIFFLVQQIWDMEIWTSTSRKGVGASCWCVLTVNVL